MSRRIAQAAPRRASWPLLRVVLRQVQLLDRTVADSIAQRYLRRSAADIIGSSGDIDAPDSAFSTALYEGMAIITEQNARREGLPPMTKAEFDMLCYCVITCGTLREVIERGNRYMHSLACKPATLSLRVSDHVAEFHIDTSYSHRDMLGMLTDLFGLAAHHRMFGWLIDCPIDLVGVQMPYVQCMDNLATSFVIPFPITYGMTSNALCFPEEFLDRPVVRTPQQLTKLLEHFPFDVNDTDIAREKLSSRVRSDMAAAISKGEKLPSEHQICEAMGLSLSTMKRRLSTEGWSYRKIKDELLHAVALRYLSIDEYSVASVAAKLGFADAGSFRQAFKRWSGHSPTRY